MTVAGPTSARAIVGRGRPRQWAEQPAPCARFPGATREVGNDPIPRITSQELESREISTLFHRVPAAILGGDDRISRFVESTFNWLGLADGSAAGGQRPFDSSLFDLARNHCEGNARTGDMLRFIPKLYSHIARKFEVYRDAGDNSLRAWPAAFYSNNRLVPVPQDIIETAWSLMSEVLASTLSDQARGLAYGVDVDVLVYPTSSLDAGRIQSLLMDNNLLSDSRGTEGYWSKLGHRIDAGKQRAAGMFKPKGVRDLFAIASLMPGFRGLLTALNDRMSEANESTLPENFKVIAPAHVDRTRYITALMGRRDNLDTQVLWDGRWVSLPITDDAMALFPSLKLSSVSDIPATSHRVLVHDLSGETDGASGNITLTLAVVDPPAHLTAG
jgi:hypothetical protein